MVKILAAYVAVGFVVMEILYFFVWCKPFDLYWAVPTPNSQCNVATNHLITNAVFNISSDVFLLILALQMVVRSQLPLHRKLVLGVIFGLGIFVVLASILNKYYSFTNPYGQAWTFWYTRESSTALLVANLPYTWTLLRRLFNLRAFDLQASQQTATSMSTCPQNAVFGYHSNRTKRARTRGQLQPSLTGTTVADPPPSASLSPKSTSKSLPKTARSDSHFSSASPGLPFLPPVAELPPPNTLYVPRRPEMLRADTAPPACLESGLVDFSGTRTRSKSPTAHTHCRSDNDLLRPWHDGDSYLYSASSASASGGEDDLEYDDAGVCALHGDPPSSNHAAAARHRHQHHEGAHACAVDGLSLGLGADGWGEGDAWHGRLHMQQRQLARQHERMRRRSTRGARSRSRAESVLALRSRLGLPVELQEVPGGGERESGGVEGADHSPRKERAKSLDARGRSRSRSRTRHRNNNPHPFPLPLPPPPPHLPKTTTSTHPPVPTYPSPVLPSLNSPQLPPPPSPVLGLSRAPPLAAKSSADQHLPTDSSLAAAPASTSSSTTARALATADFEAAKARAASRGCHGGAVDALLELEREILMSEEEDEDEEEEGDVEQASGQGRAAESAQQQKQKQAFASPALVIHSRDDGEPSHATTAPTLPSANPHNSHGTSSSPSPYHHPPQNTTLHTNPSASASALSLPLSHLTSSSTSTSKYYDTLVDAYAYGSSAHDNNPDADMDADADVDSDALDAGETTPLTEDPPSRSLELGRAAPASSSGEEGVGSSDGERAKTKEKDGWGWGGRCASRERRGVKSSGRQKAKERDRGVWRGVVGAGVDRMVREDRERERERERQG